MYQVLVRTKRFWGALGHNFLAHQGATRAAALTFTTLFALVPLLSLILSVIALIPMFFGVDAYIQDFILTYLVPSVGALVQEYLQAFIAQARHLTWIGIGALMVSTFFLLMAIEEAFNVIWHVRQPRRGVSSLLLYWGLISIGPLLLAAGFMISSYIASMVWFAEGHALVKAAAFFQWTPFLCSLAAVTLMYRVVPHVHVAWKDALLGAVFVSLLLEVAKKMLSSYFGLFPGYQLIYGAFAAVPLFLLWIYACWLIILFGAELVCSRSYGLSRVPSAVPGVLKMLGILRVMQQRQAVGLSTGWDDLKGCIWAVTVDEWLDILAYLRAQQLVQRAGRGRWHLSVEHADYRFATLVQQSPWPLPDPDAFGAVLESAWIKKIRKVFCTLRQQERARFPETLAYWLADPVEL